MSIKTFSAAIVILLLLASVTAQAGKLAIVIDDFGYRPATENQVLTMPVNISIAVLPDAPYARAMAVKAHQQGREILIHLPMAPLSKQPLERNTLTPAMSREQVVDIIYQASQKVPYAVGLNNHMGSAMTSSLSGMQNVMQALSSYSYYFLDSMTIGNSQSVPAAAGTGVRVLKRRVFLDDIDNEVDIRAQFNRAVVVARRNGSAIAIGHPHPTTVRVLQQMLPSLPGDIVLVRPSMLLNERPEPGTAVAPMGKPAPARRLPFRGAPYCSSRQTLAPVYADTMVNAIASSVAETWRGLLRGETMPKTGKLNLGKPDDGKPDDGAPVSVNPTAASPTIVCPLSINPTQAKLASIIAGRQNRATRSSPSGKGEVLPTQGSSGKKGSPLASSSPCNHSRNTACLARATPYRGDIVCGCASMLLCTQLMDGLSCGTA